MAQIHIYYVQIEVLGRTPLTCCLSVFTEGFSVCYNMLDGK